jgi:hypothetical protein
MATGVGISKCRELRIKNLFCEERHKALDKHGRNVIDFASRVPVASAETREDALAGAANLSTTRWQAHTFTRQALYRLVWAESTRTLSKRFGISDVGLAKACLRANIPTPDRGYWARVSAGQKCEKTPLPPLETGAAKIVRFRGHPVAECLNHVASEIS